MTNHPAKYNKPILDVISQVIKNNYPTQPISILDCFGGVGGIHDLSSDTWGTYAIEIEREWADVSREKGWTDWGDFFDFEPNTAWFRQDEHKYAPSPTMFDVVAVSCTYGNRMADHHEAKDDSKRMTYRHQLGRPLTENNSGGMQWGCVAPDTLVLTKDMRWVPVGELATGDVLVGFDEDIPAGELNMRMRGRRFRDSVVLDIARDTRPCVRVIFDDGHTIVCTRDHPFLAVSGRASHAKRWILAAELVQGDTLGVYFEPWSFNNTHNGGWLAGMFDGEGHVSGNTIGIAQNDGPVLDRVKSLLGQDHFRFKSYINKDCRSLTMTGGLAERCRLLGALRPTRLLPKIVVDNIYMRALRQRTVVSVVDVGEQEIVLMGTSTKTYITDGMGSHNTEYRLFHEAAWTKVRTLLEYGGLLILNVKDHVRKGEVIKVCDWHKDFITHEVGMTCIDDIKVPVNGMGFGANGKSRVDHERVIVFLK